jgi:protease I
MSKKICIITAHGCRDEEVLYPFYRMQEEGYKVHIATLNGVNVVGEDGYVFMSNIDFTDLDVASYDCVIIPGGYKGPDSIRMNSHVKNMVRSMFDSNKLVAAICHGVWIPISAGIMKDKKATCYPSMVDDLINAGGVYIDAPVVIDGNLVTSRRPKDLPFFCKEIVEFLKKNSVHALSD